MIYFMFNNMSSSVRYNDSKIHDKSIRGFCAFAAAGIQLLAIRGGPKYLFDNVFIYLFGRPVN